MITKQLLFKIIPGRSPEIARFTESKELNTIIHCTDDYRMKSLTRSLHSDNVKTPTPTLTYVSLTLICTHVHSLIRSIYTFLAGRVYVRGDQIFLRSARNYEVSLKFLQVS